MTVVVASDADGVEAVDHQVRKARALATIEQEDRVAGAAVIAAFFLAGIIRIRWVRWLGVAAATEVVGLDRGNQPGGLTPGQEQEQRQSEEAKPSIGSAHGAGERCFVP